MKFLPFLSLLIIAGCIIVISPAYAQSDEEKTEAIKEEETATTIDESNTQKENIQAEKVLNEERKDDADALRKEYKGKAKDAKRIEKDASYASKQARISAKRERQAQKARRSAEKQTIKAKKAADKSDGNQ
jgi:hypothetical protein